MKVSELEDLEQQRSQIKSQMTSLQEAESKITCRIKELKSQQLPLVLYTIRARPSRSDHCEHTVGYFTTVENAQRLLPHSGHSYDDEDNCTWVYTIEVYSGSGTIDPETVDPLSLPHFPYRGW
jgi:hypothetical protein